MPTTPFTPPLPEAPLTRGPVWWRRPEWRAAAFLAVAAALNYADRAALSAVLPPLRADFSLTDLQLGLLGSAFLWSYSLCSPLAGAIADRWSPYH